MRYFFLIPLVILILWLTRGGSHKEEHFPRRDPKTAKTAGSEHELSLDGIYQKRGLLSSSEQEAYVKLKPIADDLGYTVFAKVRLLDLLEPATGLDRYKTYSRKLQAKYVDFVLCDRMLAARYIIELDDREQGAADGQERDSFLDRVVTSVGYPIIHVQEITDDLKQQLVGASS
jgi:hypothetical protein